MKPGYKTTEFWLTAIVNVAAAIVAILAARGLVSSEEGELWVQLVESIAVAVLPIVMAVVTAAYVNGRSAIKSIEANQ